MSSTKVPSKIITYDNTSTSIVSTDVQSVVTELNTKIEAFDVNALANHEINTAAHPSENVTYDNTNSTLVATDVKAGLDELSTLHNNIEQAVVAVTTDFNTMKTDSNELTGFIRESPNTMGIMEFSPDGTTIFVIDQNSNFTKRTDGLFASGTVYETNALAMEFVIYPVPTESEYNVYVQGTKFHITSLQKIVVPNETGLKFIFHDINGNLSTDSVFSFEYFEYLPITSTIYWNNLTQEVVNFGDERHGIQMDGFTHRYLHFTEGTRYISGMEVQGLTDTGTTFGQVTGGKAYDEDIFMVSPNQLTAPHVYNINGGWDKTVDSADLALMVAGNAVYNQELTPDTFVLTPLGATEIMPIFFAFTNNKEFPYIKLVGQEVYADVTQARADIVNAIGKLKLSGLPSPEFVAISAVLVDNLGKLHALTDGSTQLDLRTVSVTGTGSTSTAPTNHTDLLGTTSSNSHPATAISYNPINSGLVSSNTQDALDEVQTNIDGVFNLSLVETLVPKVLTQDGTAYVWVPNYGGGVAGGVAVEPFYFDVTRNKYLSHSTEKVIFYVDSPSIKNIYLKYIASIASNTVPFITLGEQCIVGFELQMTTPITNTVDVLQIENITAGAPIYHVNIVGTDITQVYDNTLNITLQDTTKLALYINNTSLGYPVLKLHIKKIYHP